MIEIIILIVAIIFYLVFLSWVVIGLTKKIDRIIDKMPLEFFARDVSDVIKHPGAEKPIMSLLSCDLTLAMKIYEIYQEDMKKSKHYMIFADWCKERLSNG